MRILIVEDERAVASALADSVSLQGHVPIVAHSGLEGLAAIDAEVPDMVFLDLDEIQRLGVTDIVQKPWALKRLDEALQRLEIGECV